MKKVFLEKPMIQSLDRGLVILEAVAKSPRPVPLGNLTELLGIDRSSVFRLAHTLKRRGFLSNPDGRKDYVIGPSVWHLFRGHDWSKLTVFCGEHLKILAARTGETAHLAVREGRRALFIDHVAPSTTQMIVVSGQTGAFVPVYCTAHGKALLADCGFAELEAIFNGEPFTVYTPNTITSIEELAKACANIKTSGIAIDDGEYTPDVHCVAAPIRDRNSTVIASIGVSAPVTRFANQRIALAEHAVEAANEISAILRGSTRV